MKDALLKRINDRKATIGIIGLGYVGLPLAVEFGKRQRPLASICRSQG